MKTKTDIKTKVKVKFTTDEADNLVREIQSIKENYGNDESFQENYATTQLLLNRLKRILDDI